MANLAVVLCDGIACYGSLIVRDTLIDELSNVNRKAPTLDCPQKVRHYLGVFLWKEKSSTTMHLNLNA